MNNDIQWLATQPDSELKSYIRNSDTITLLNFPPTSQVTCDNRQYTQAVHHIAGLASNNLHLVTCSLAAPGSVAAIFIPAMSSGRAIVRFQDSNLSLSYIRDEPIPIKLGDRGVAIHSVYARREWNNLSDKIGAKILVDAQLPVGSSGISPIFEKWPRSRPPAGATSAEITKFGMDASQRVTNVMNTRHDSKFSTMLGEVQLAFIGFLYMGCEDALRHWAAIVKELCTCSDMFSTNPARLRDFIRLLEAEIPFLDSEVCSVLHHAGLQGSVAEFWQEFGSTFHSTPILEWLASNNDEFINGEDGPTLVELS